MKNIFLLCLSAFSIQFAMGQCAYIEQSFYNKKSKCKYKEKIADDNSPVSSLTIDELKDYLNNKLDSNDSSKNKLYIGKLIGGMQFDGFVFKPVISVPYSATLHSKRNKKDSSSLWNFKADVYLCPNEIDSVRSGALHRFLIDENSLYGIRIQATYLMLVAGKSKDRKLYVGFHLKSEFLGNQIQLIKNKSLVSSKVGASISLQYANLVTAYVNYNFISPMTNVSVFREYFNTSYLEYNYFDIGLNLILDSDLVSRLNNTKVKLNINLIPTEQAGLKGIYPVEQDKVIPSISLGVAQIITNSNNKKNKH